MSSERSEMSRALADALPDPERQVFFECDYDSTQVESYTFKLYGLDELLRTKRKAKLKPQPTRKHSGVKIHRTTRA